MCLLTLLLLLAAAYVKCHQLTQPSSLTLQPGDLLTLNCQVCYSVNDTRTNWIRQPVGKGLEWVCSAHFGHATHYKESLKNKFRIDLEPSSNTVTLTGQNMQPEDTAVYYCASQSH
ncbi:hypothetical protein CHARACLAT_023089 [Characodon lateralis]|uniref:Ig-like domain-containing protein n=1 Tax=Characodon lateralis TaxID=208331 RepID=A0ABU7DJI8_9TELE|nr:hypothetical protein [Characodon lateralis]